MLFASLPGFKSFKLDDLVAALDVNKDGLISREECLTSKGDEPFHSLAP